MITVDNSKFHPDYTDTITEKIKIGQKKSIIFKM